MKPFRLKPYFFRQFSTYLYRELLRIWRFEIPEYVFLLMGAPQLLDFPSDKEKKHIFVGITRGICWFYILDLLGYSKHINVYLMCLEISNYISVSILRVI